MFDDDDDDEIGRQICIIPTCVIVMKIDIDCCCNKCIETIEEDVP